MKKEILKNLEFRLWYNMFARRIDYFFVSKSMQENIKKVKIYKDIYGSDHVPMEINIKETKRWIFYKQIWGFYKGKISLQVAKHKRTWRKENIKL